MENRENVISDEVKRVYDKYRDLFCKDPLEWVDDVSNVMVDLSFYHYRHGENVGRSLYIMTWIYGFFLDLLKAKEGKPIEE